MSNGHHRCTDGWAFPAGAINIAALAAATEQMTAPHRCGRKAHRGRADCCWSSLAEIQGYMSFQTTDPAPNVGL